jgi:hypothetical protein
LALGGWSAAERAARAEKTFDERRVALLPLGRRCPVEPEARLPRDGADEGAFLTTTKPLTSSAE